MLHFDSSPWSRKVQRYMVVPVPFLVSSLPLTLLDVFNGS